MMFNPQYIVILTGLFRSVVTSSASLFYSFFSVNDLAGGLNFGMTTMTMAWQAKPRPKTEKCT